MERFFQRGQLPLRDWDKEQMIQVVSVVPHWKLAARHLPPEQLPDSMDESSVEMQPSDEEMPDQRSEGSSPDEDEDADAVAAAATSWRSQPIRTVPAFDVAIGFSEQFIDMLEGQADEKRRVVGLEMVLLDYGGDRVRRTVIGANQAIIPAESCVMHHVFPATYPLVIEGPLAEARIIEVNFYFNGGEFARAEFGLTVFDPEPDFDHRLHGRHRVNYNDRDVLRYDVRFMKFSDSHPFDADPQRPLEADETKGPGTPTRLVWDAAPPPGNSQEEKEEDEEGEDLLLHSEASEEKEEEPDTDDQSFIVSDEHGDDQGDDGAEDDEKKEEEAGQREEDEEKEEEVEEPPRDFLPDLPSARRKQEWQRFVENRRRFTTPGRLPTRPPVPLTDDDEEGALISSDEDKKDDDDLSSLAAHFLGIRL